MLSGRLPDQAVRTERQKLVGHLMDDHGVAVGSAARMTMVQAEQRHAKEHDFANNAWYATAVLRRAAAAAWLTTAQVSGATGLSLYRTRKLLKEMVDAGTVVEARRKGRWYYRVVDDGS